MSENQQLSPEELEAKRQELIDFYSNQIPILKMRKEYEELQTEIQELQTRKVYAQVKMAQMMYNSNNEDNGTSESSEQNS
jgi:hypothetical protein